MGEDRESPKWSEQLIDQIVLFHLKNLTEEKHTEVILRVRGIHQFKIEGDFIAGDINYYNDLQITSLKLTKTFIYRNRLDYIMHSDISSYEILTRRELPLLIGYNYTTPLLAELIRGE